MSYPEHDKLRAVSNLSQAQGEFLDWLGQEKGWTLGEWRAQESELFWPVNYSLQNLLAEYHGIDRVQLEREKLAMIDELSAAPEPQGAEAGA